MNYYVQMFGISLGLTLLFEMTLAFILGVREKRSLAVVFLVNVLTNPAAVFLSYAVSVYAYRFLVPVQLFSEVLVVLIEGIIYNGFDIRGRRVKNPFLLSLILNAFSYSAGLLINLIR
ncbi:MAG: hypothetical protein IJL98_02475 [Lachnospiraceae bacterium]|nr:hypothetical protein [Lachnospiraceae bacterium]